MACPVEKYYRPRNAEALLAIPVDRAGLIEHYVLSEQDLSLVRQRRGDHNRLGIAVQLALLRFPGIALQADKAPPQEIDQFSRAAVEYPFQRVGRVCSA
jgi:TnpA family transposase